VLYDQLLTKKCSGDQIEKNEMGGACRTYGGEERCIRSSGGWGNLREGKHLEDPGVYGGILLTRIFRKCDGAWNRFIWLRIGMGGGLL
jgi:hypothetical protein